MPARRSPFLTKTSGRVPEARTLDMIQLRFA